MNLGGVKDLKKVKDFGSKFYSFLLEDDPKIYGEVMRSIHAPFFGKKLLMTKIFLLKLIKLGFLLIFRLVVKV